MVIIHSILIILFIYLSRKREDIFWDIFDNITCNSCKESSSTNNTYLCKKCDRRNKISISLKNGRIKSLYYKLTNFLISNRNIIDLVNFILLIIIISVKYYIYGFDSNIYYDLFIIYFWIYNIYMKILTSRNKTI